MREIRLSGSEGGGTEYNPFSLPLPTGFFSQLRKRWDRAAYNRA
jgi:hypothetical protein